MPTSKKKRAYFRLDAPAAKSVFVSGTFNDWDPTARPLKRDKKGIWRTWMNLEPGEYQYLFIVDGTWREDPECDQREVNPYGSHNSAFRL